MSAPESQVATIISKRIKLIINASRDARYHPSGKSARCSGWLTTAQETPTKVVECYSIIRNLTVYLSGPEDVLSLRPLKICVCMYSIFVIVIYVLYMLYLCIITSIFTFSTKPAGTSEISRKHRISISKNRQVQPIPQLLHFEVPPCKADLRPANPQFDATTIGRHENSCCSWPWPPGKRPTKRDKKRNTGGIKGHFIMSCILLWIYMTSHLSRNTNGKDDEMAGSRWFPPKSLPRLVWYK